MHCGVSGRVHAEDRAGRRPEPEKWLLEINPLPRAEDVTFTVEGIRRLRHGDAYEARPATQAERHPTAASEPILVRRGGNLMLEFDGQRALLPDRRGLKNI